MSDANLRQAFSPKVIEGGLQDLAEVGVAHAVTRIVLVTRSF